MRIVSRQIEMNRSFQFKCNRKGAICTLTAGNCYMVLKLITPLYNSHTYLLSFISWNWLIGKGKI